MNDFDDVLFIVILLGLCALVASVSCLSIQELKQRELNLKKAQSAYETQLKTYVNCMQKSTDKTICGTMPNATDYFNLTLK